MRGAALIGCLLAVLVLVSPAAAQESGLALWGRIHEVFSHPRCANCHVGPDNVPIWSGDSYGLKGRPHGMNIDGGASRIGAESILCSTCHGRHNTELAHGPPGAEKDGQPSWQLPPPSMQWFGMSSASVPIPKFASIRGDL